MNEKVFAVLILAFLFLEGVSYGISEEAKTVGDALVQARTDITQMKDAGFSTQHVEDILAEAKIIYDAQVQQENSGEKADFASVIKKAQEISSLKEQAFEASDELKALEIAIQEAKKQIDVAEVESIYSEAVNEFQDERYEKSREFIESAYKKLLEVEAKSTTTAALYEATKNTVANFIETNWKIIAAVIVAFLVFLFVAHNRIVVYRLNRKVRELEIEKETINDLIKKTQKEYFEKGKMPESTYSIRIKKFGELIRDINRQIPLLAEQIAKKKNIKIKGKKRAILDLTGTVKRNSVSKKAQVL